VVIRAQESKSAPVGVLSKLLELLEALDTAPSGLQLGAIAKQTGINKSTAYRFLAHLEREGYLFRDLAGAYLVSPKLARLGAGMSYNATLCSVSRPIIKRLWKLTSETVNLAVLDGRHVLYIHVMESEHSFRLVSQVGMRRPLHCTALGKAILAFTQVDEREAIIRSLDLERFSPNTITSSSGLRRDFEKIRRSGSAIDDEEAGLGSRCAAAPIFDRSSKVVAAISVSGPTARIDRTRLNTFGKVIREGAGEISRKLGYRGRGSGR